MKKTLMTLLAAATVVSALAGAATTASAGGGGGGGGFVPGLLGGFVAGAIVGGAIASHPAPGYVVYPGYAAPVAAPGCYWTRIPVYDPYGNVIGWRGRPAQVCP